MSQSALLAALLGPVIAVGFTSGEPRDEQILKRFVDEFVQLTPGEGKYPASFTMGSPNDKPAAEQPAHEVTFKHPFAIAKYEVTQELYELIIGSNPSKWRGRRNS